MNIINNRIKINENCNIYILSDIHGEKALFYKMLDKINFKDDDLMIIIGDVIDRGRYGIELLQEINKMDNVILLKGNHEEMMYNAIVYEQGLKEWYIFNGGMYTYDEYEKLKQDEKYKILSTIKELPEYLFLEYNNKKYFLVHAGLILDCVETLEEMVKWQNSSQFLWIRKEFLKSKVDTGYKIIFGHTPTCFIKYELNKYPSFYKSESYNYGKVYKDLKEKSYIWFDKNKIGIDCGAYASGRLGCLKLNDLKCIYVE